MEAVDKNTVVNAQVQPTDVTSDEKQKLVPDSPLGGATLPSGSTDIVFPIGDHPAPVKNVEIPAGSTIDTATVDFFGAKNDTTPLNKSPVSLTPQNDGSLKANPKDIPHGRVHKIVVHIQKTKGDNQPIENVKLSVEACTEATRTSITGTHPTHTTGTGTHATHTSSSSPRGSTLGTPATGKQAREREGERANSI